MLAQAAGCSFIDAFVAMPGVMNLTEHGFVTSGSAEYATQTTAWRRLIEQRRGAACNHTAKAGYGWHWQVEADDDAND